LQEKVYKYASGKVKKKKSWALVAHSCNPSYSGGRDLENQSSKPAQANGLRDLISKNPLQKYGWWSSSR
jgi:hypothetical protein